MQAKWFWKTEQARYSTKVLFDPVTFSCLGNTFKTTAVFLILLVFDRKLFEKTVYNNECDQYQVYKYDYTEDIFLEISSLKKVLCEFWSPNYV